MIITPMKPHKFEAKVPAEPKPDDQTIAKPNPLTLVVAINSSDRKVTLNNTEAGNVTDASDLTTRLSTIFKEREATGAFREGTNEVEKTVFIKSPRSMKYGEVVRVIDAVKQAGAQPIGLQIDDLAQ
jgi:biopolymer transport protein ExbD